jgi:hypothetical protein
MAMNGDRLGQEIAGAIINPKATPEAKEASLAFWQKISGVIIKHIQDNAEVPVGIELKTPDTINGATTAPGKVI